MMHQWCQQSTENRIGHQFLLKSISKTDCQFQSRPHSLLLSQLLRTDRFENQHHYPNIQPAYPRSIGLASLAHKRGLLQLLSQDMLLQGNYTKDGLSSQKRQMYRCSGWLEALMRK